MSVADLEMYFAKTFGRILITVYDLEDLHMDSHCLSHHIFILPFRSFVIIIILSVLQMYLYRIPCHILCKLLVFTDHWHELLIASHVRDHDRPENSCT